MQYLKIQLGNSTKWTQSNRFLCLISSMLVRILSDHMAWPWTSIFLKKKHFLRILISSEFRLLCYNPQLAKELIRTLRVFHLNSFFVQLKALHRLGVNG